LILIYDHSWLPAEYVNPLKMKCRVFFFLKIQFVLRSKHFSSWL
jgi:hypothetical protein